MNHHTRMQIVEGCTLLHTDLRVPFTFHESMRMIADLNRGDRRSLDVKLKRHSQGNRNWESNPYTSFLNMSAPKQNKRVIEDDIMDPITIGDSSTGPADSPAIPPRKISRKSPLITVAAVDSPTQPEPTATALEEMQVQLIDIQKCIQDSTDKRFRSASNACKTLAERLSAIEVDIAVFKDWRKRVDGMLNLAYFAAMRMHEKGEISWTDSEFLYWTTMCDWECCDVIHFAEFIVRTDRTLGETEGIRQRLSRIIRIR